MHGTNLHLNAVVCLGDVWQRLLIGDRSLPCALCPTSEIFLPSEFIGVRRIGSDCTSGDERSRSVSIQISTAELVSQTLRCPRALLPAIVGCDLFAARNTVRERCLLATAACLLPPAATACYICRCRLLCETRPEVARVWRPF